MNSQNKIQEEIIEIKGMHCKSCVERIEAKLSQLKGMDKARVSLVEEKAYVSFDPAQTNLDTIKKEIESLGYKTDLKSKTEKSSIKQGIIYGLIPHTGCIAFILASVLGVTVATELFKPLLLNPYFFYILILMSFIFATISAIIYMKKQGFITFNKSEGGLEIGFSPEGIKRKWKYLSTLYGTTIGVNLLLFIIIFPLLANVSAFSSSTTGAFVGVASNENVNSISSIRLKVDIPCSGHAPLISQELKSINGVVGVQFSFPNIFDVKYDSTKTSKQQILSLDVFKTYKATVLDESTVQQNTQQSDNQPSSSGGGCGGGSCECGCGSR
jgi:copper chaperone CopZ